MKYIIIKISDRVLQERNNDLYETVRSAWRVKLRNVEDYKYCLAVLNGVVKNVYSIERWDPDHRGVDGRYEFTGKEAPDEIRRLFVNKKIPKEYRKKGNASPVRYHN